MQPEELKIIAEGMGYEVHLEMGVRNNQGMMCLYIHHANGTRTEYAPDTTNDTQCMEIMKELKTDIEYWYRLDEWEANPRRDEIPKRGKTINEAVCKAALEYYKKQ